MIVVTAINVLVKMSNPRRLSRGCVSQAFEVAFNVATTIRQRTASRFVDCNCAIPSISVGRHDCSTHASTLPIGAVCLHKHWGSLEHAMLEVASSRHCSYGLSVLLRQEIPAVALTAQSGTDGILRVSSHHIGQIKYRQTNKPINAFILDTMLHYRHDWDRGCPNYGHIRQISLTVFHKKLNLW